MTVLTTSINRFQSKTIIPSTRRNKQIDKTNKNNRKYLLKIIKKKNNLSSLIQICHRHLIIETKINIHNNNRKEKRLTKVMRFCLLSERMKIIILKKEKCIFKNLLKKVIKIKTMKKKITMLMKAININHIIWKSLNNE